MNKALASLCLFAFAGLVFSAGISFIESIVVNVHHSFEASAEAKQPLKYEHHR